MPSSGLPQQCFKLDAELPLRENELLIEVESLNIDSASFHQLRQASGDDEKKITDAILSIVKERGKMQNPVTGSGGMLIGKVSEVGPKFLTGRHASEHVKVGDRIASLVSLTLTPLKIRSIKKLFLDRDRVDIEGHAILFQSGPFCVLPTDMSEPLALAVLDVCGAPAQTDRLCKKGMTVLIVGGAGKSGLLCAYQAKKNVGKAGRVIALDYSNDAVAQLKNFSFIDEAYACDARDAMAVHSLVKKITDEKMADVVINVTNIPDTEMSCILAAKPRGIVYYFSMATSFTKAALGSEGVGADVDLMMGNGYAPGHAALTLNLLRESQELREFYTLRYGTS